MTAPSSDPQSTTGAASADSPRPDSTPTLPPAARRALAEAEARRAATAHTRTSPNQPLELGGRDGPEPVRFGDWEKKGIAIDF